MGPATTVGLAWLLFGGTHVGLSTRAVRARLVARLGEAGFTAVYFLVATVTFTVLVGTYGALRDAGAAGLGAGPLRPALRPALSNVRTASFCCSVSPIALITSGSENAPGPDAWRAICFSLSDCCGNSRADNSDCVRAPL